jgi:hypothetical protein
MDLEKIRVRQDLERMVINYFLMGKISEEQSNRIANYVDDVIGGGCFPEPVREGKIIAFPGVYKGTPPEPKTPREPEPEMSYGDCCEAFKDFKAGKARYLGMRIILAFCSLHIHSLEELAKTPVNKLLRIRGIGRKSIECIRADLESRGFTLGRDWDMVTREKQEEVL